MDGRIIYDVTTYTADGDRLTDIYSVNPDGSDEMLLTEETSIDWWPQWSPDGTRIAYFNVVEEEYYLMAMDADGGNKMSLSSSEPLSGVGQKLHGPFSWSPDSSKILYTSNDDLQEGCQASIWVTEADGSARHPVTHSLNCYRYPSWSPDGSKILHFVRRDLFLMNADGTNRQELVEDIEDPVWYRWGIEGGPEWSPDGSKIFYFDRDDLYVINADGTDPRRLAKEVYSAEWSPDGSKIAYARRSDIFLIGPDGSDLRSVTDTESREDDLTWSPSGKRIAFARYDPQRFRTSDIVLISPNGKNETRLTDNYKADYVPEWSPSGERLVIQREFGYKIGEYHYVRFHAYVLMADGTDEFRITTQGESDYTDWQAVSS